VSGALAERCRRLKLLLTDVDGVLTDGRVLLLPDGQEAQAFHIRDGMGIVLAQRAGLTTGVLSGRLSPLVARRAAQLGMSVVRQGIASKRTALREILAERGIGGHEVAYMGDDVNDLGVMEDVGLSAAPADAAFEVRSRAFMITEAAGGGGCLREFVEAILRARGCWDEVVASLGRPES
jgi:3-deoxy-D-manno-octulosonate 8-phosphate phosphatase (KDO 8-P phosphatase)